MRQRETSIQNIMKRKSTSLAVMAFSVLAAVSSQAAITYTVGTTYSQNFNTLNGVTTWTNDSTLPGWFAATTATTSITSIGSNTGSTTTAGLYSFGVAGTNLVSERALGFAPSNSFTGSAGAGIGALGLSFSHTVPSPMTSFTLTYDGEQWRKDNTVTQSITVQYQITSSAINTASLVSATGWVSAGSALTFNSPLITTGATALDGNASANRVAGLTATVSSISWSSTQNLWIRFVDLNDSGNDHFLAIDNVTFSAVPEPSTALLGGLGLLALLRRRRR
jgi:trimeric autotransporter adhesin